MTRILLFVIVFSAAAAAGCSSGTANSGGPAANGGNTSQSTVPSANPPNANSEPGTVASVPVAPEVPGTASGPLSGGKTGKTLVDTDPGGPIPEGQRVPASENSEMSSTMDKAGNFVETRYFKTDPMLIKVQRTWLGPNKSTLKIWLKSGKIATASGESIPNLAVAPISSLLALAGVRSAAPADTRAK